MPRKSPRSGEADIAGGSTSVHGSGGPTRTDLETRDADAASRTYWEAAADAYQAEHGAFLADPRVWVVGGSADAGFVWGPEGLTEAELHVLGRPEKLAGRPILEVGCGAAQCSTWLAGQGAHAVGLDISLAQLRHARAPDPPAPPGAREPVGVAPVGARPGKGAAGSLALVAGTATALPFAKATFDLAFSAYGAVQFVSDLDRLLAEVARVLRPGGRWCFSVTHPIRWAFPDEPDEAGLAVSGSYFDRTPYVERDDSGAAIYAEFHRTLGDYVAALVRAGFVVDALVEPEWPQWNDQTWGGWSPLRGWYLPGTLILGARLLG